MGTDGWIPNGARYQGKYFHLSSLYAIFKFAYLLKHHTGFQVLENQLKYYI